MTRAACEWCVCVYVCVCMCVCCGGECVLWCMSVHVCTRGGEARCVQLVSGVCKSAHNGAKVEEGHSATCVSGRCAMA